jgi:hypothetical protein
MQPSNDKDLLFDPKTNHYLELIMRNAPRDTLPHKPENWKQDRLSQNNPIHSLFTYNHFPYSVASSSFQASIRQSRVLEACQWALEMSRADSDIHVTDPLQKGRRGMGISNLWTRLAVISVEDVGLANPMMIIALSQVLDKTYSDFEQEEMAAINATVLMARSYKSRFVDWSCHINIGPNIPFDQSNLNASMILYHDSIIENLKIGNHFQLIPYFKTIIQLSLQDKETKNPITFPSDLFKTFSAGVLLNGKAIKYYKNKRQILWICIAKVLTLFPNHQTVRQIVQACYDLAHADRFRWKGESSLFEHCAIMTVCLRDQIETRGLDLRLAPVEECFQLRKDLSQQDIQSLLIQHKEGAIWYPVSEICKDKHTKEGKMIGRGIQHFMELKMFLRHEDHDLKALNDFYLKYVIITSNSSNSVTGTLFDKSQMTYQEYSNWVPELRKRFDRMTAIENKLCHQTITITWGNRVENYQGMEMIGQDIPEGFTIHDLSLIHQNFTAIGVKSELIDLNQALNGTGVEGEPAALLILRDCAHRLISPSSPSSPSPNSINSFNTTDYLFEEMANLNWDKKKFSKGKVVNAIARYNLCFANQSQEPDYENKKGRIYGFDQVPLLKSIREKFVQCFGPKANNLFAEGNNYYDLKNCYCGLHGDQERRIVIAFRLGSSMSLKYQWYQDSKEIGIVMQFILHHNDLYIMSSKAVGTDWHKRKIATLRHGANIP